MPSTLKLILYRTARAAGLFALARWLTRKRLRILAYHAFASGDVLRFRPKLFISPATFERRMKRLRDRGFRVLTLDQAVGGSAQGAGGGAVVITIDDGYASTLSIAAPILQHYRLPATVYVTTYHVLKQTPVFDLALAYLLWKSGAHRLEWNWPSYPELRALDLSTSEAREDAMARLLAVGHSLPSETDRIEMCEALGAALGQSYAAIVAGEAFRLMTADELRRITQFGVEVALHTHRHRFPIDDLDICRNELLENQALLADMTGSRSSHFCYPSGVYSVSQWPLLRDMGIASATTCDTGLVRADDPVFGLRRFLDGEMVSDVEFDAEICGFAELMRSLLYVRRAANASA